MTTQLIAASPAAQTAEADSSVNFDVVYSTVDPADATTTGLTLRMHYNSSQLAPDMTAIINSAFDGATIQDMADEDDFDNDVTTDRMVNFLWIDIGGNFPAGHSLPLTVFTASFSTSAAFAGATVDFTSAPPPNVDFTTIPAQIDLDNGPLAGNVDGDTDFDANDSFLIHLVKLAGTNTQIDQSKGGSTLTADEIRTLVDTLPSADVDGDSDVDANDSFLIHLVKLSGTDTQIDQSKGASSLSATQIRARVNAMGEDGSASRNYADSRNYAISSKLQQMPGMSDTTLEVPGLNVTAAQDGHPEPVDEVWSASRSWLDLL